MKIKLINTTQKQLAREYGIYIRKQYLTRNRKFLAWLPVAIELTEEGNLIAIDGWNRITHLI